MPAGAQVLPASASYAAHSVQFCPFLAEQPYRKPLFLPEVSVVFSVDPESDYSLHAIETGECEESCDERE